MKTLTYGVVALLLSLFVIEACTKTGVATTGQLGATKLIINANDMDTLSVIGLPPTASTSWSVRPAANFGTINLVGNVAVIKFTQAGTYTVSASVNGATPLTIVITVNPAVTSPATTIPLTGDQVSLRVNLQKGPVVDSVYLWFGANTVKQYPCGNTELICTNNLDSSNGFHLNFINIAQSAGCTAIPSVSPTRHPIVFNQNTLNPYMVNGTYPLVVTLNGITYTGSITVTATDINFTWPYTSGVLLTTLHISR